MSARPAPATVDGEAAWMAAMPAADRSAFAAWVDGATSPALPARLSQVMLFAIHLCRGRSALAARHGARATGLGMSPAQWREVLLLLVGSRGPALYEDGARLLALAPSTDDGGAAGDESAEGLPSTDAIVGYFKEQFADVPAFVRLLARHQPALLAGYFHLRRRTLVDGAVPRRDKELLLVAVNAAERYATGMEIHGRGALACGATPAELLAAMTLAVLGGGMPAWIEAAAVFDRLVPP